MNELKKTKDGVKQHLIDEEPKEKKKVAKKVATTSGEEWSKDKKKEKKDGKSGEKKLKKRKVEEKVEEKVKETEVPKKKLKVDESKPSTTSKKSVGDKLATMSKEEKLARIKLLKAKKSSK